MTGAQDLTGALEESSERIAVLERRRTRAIAERDELLAQAVLAGMRQADIARACRVNPARAHQLVNRSPVLAQVAQARGPAYALMSEATRKLLEA